METYVADMIDTNKREYKFSLIFMFFIIFILSINNKRRKDMKKDIAKT